MIGTRTDRLALGGGAIAAAARSARTAVGVRTGGEGVFLASTLSAFVVCVAGTIYSCRLMSGEMRMPGDWSMSMAWMRMPGQSWPAAAAMFMAMWLIMMVAMMMWSLLPMLTSYRTALRAAGSTTVGVRTALAACGYFLVWQAVGALAYPVGAGIAAATMWSSTLSRAAPLLWGAALIFSGYIQLSSWKMTRLSRCRGPETCVASGPAGDRWLGLKYGLRMGVNCALCCAGYMLTLLVLGVMDLRVMTVVAAAITAERILPRSDVVVRILGGTVVILGAIATLAALLRLSGIAVHR